MKLYFFPVAPNPTKVRLYVAEKRAAGGTLDLTEELVDLPKGAHKQAEHLARNPLGRLPVLELADGTYLTESLAIIEYLEEISPEPPLIGRHRARARTRARAGANRRLGRADPGRTRRSRDEITARLAAVPRGRSPVSAHPSGGLQGSRCALGGRTAVPGRRPADDRRLHAGGRASVRSFRRRRDRPVVRPFAALGRCLPRARAGEIGARPLTMLATAGPQGGNDVPAVRPLDLSGR